MQLAIRMGLYWAFTMLSAQGLILFDEGAQTVTFKVDDVAIFLAGVLGYLGTFAWSRIAKAKGGPT